MKKLSLIMAVLMAIGLFAGCAQQENAEQLPGDEEAPAKEYQYITADEVKTMIENGDEKVIVDIQPEEYYAQGHLPTAISTYAYPADTDELKAKLDTALEKIDEKEGPVIIVGLGGKTGAEKTAALSEVEQKFLDANFIVPIFQHNEVSACKSYVSGMETGVLGHGYLFDALTVSK